MLQIDCCQIQAVKSCMIAPLQEICETWKLRTPNEWEPIQWWSQVLSWRNQVCFPCSLLADEYLLLHLPWHERHAMLQVYNLTIRQFGAMQNIAPNMHQMGYRCTVRYTVTC
jgi:transformation/transcription domain-associated protein